jgi:dTDP-4-dehydrorhamnose 3,5-epimerase
MKGQVNPREITLGAIDGVELWQMPVFSDLRGRLFKAYVGGDQGSFSKPFTTYEHFFTESHKNVFRGMHFQGAPHSVSKIVSIVRGAAIAYFLDTRVESPSFGHLQVVEFQESAPLSIFIPVGVAFGYLILEESTVISYRMDGAFCANCDGGIGAEVVAPYLPVDLQDTIRSDRDLALERFETFEYSSNCTRK